MSEELWVPSFLESLGEISDVSAQRRAWIDGDSSSGFPDPTELVCQVFDDSGLDDALAAGRVFSDEADDLLRQLRVAAAALDVSGEPESWINDVQWTEVTELAKRALSAISKARGG